MITKEPFLEKYNISEKLFQSAGMSWEELIEIYNDFIRKRDDKYEIILNQFFDEYLKDIVKDENEDNVKIHSIRSRVKNPEHLLAKIVRKKQENYSKYKKLDKDNYEKFITDLIGFRCLVLFKADWQNFHHYILSKFDNKPEYYIKDPILDFDKDENHFYIAEKPKVHIRNGDARDIYEDVLPPDSILDGKVYRSVHYIIKYKGIYLEIQVRTLFEEGWGEVDHAVVYPFYQKDKILKEYTELLNRLSGLADEMSSFFNRLKILEKRALDDDMKNQEIKIEESGDLENGHTEDKIDQTVKEKSMDTPNDCMQSVLAAE